MGATFAHYRTKLKNDLSLRFGVKTIISLNRQLSMNFDQTVGDYYFMLLARLKAETTITHRCVDFKLGRRGIASCISSTDIVQVSVIKLFIKSL